MYRVISDTWIFIGTIQRVNEWKWILLNQHFDILKLKRRKKERNEGKWKKKKIVINRNESEKAGFVLALSNRADCSVYNIYASTTKIKHAWHTPTYNTYIHIVDRFVYHQESLEYFEQRWLMSPTNIVSTLFSIEYITFKISWEIYITTLPLLSFRK